MHLCKQFVCHFSPLKSDTEVELKDGDLVKVDLGAHIDGFIAVAAHSLIVGASKDNVVTGRKADVLMAAHLASEAALRLVKPGTENVEVTQAINLVAHSYECTPIEGMLSHQLKQHIIDGEKSIIQNPSENQKSGKPLESWEDFGRGTLQGGGRKDHEKCEFETHEVYAIDVIISTGEGKGREQEARTTVYKKRDLTYNLKMKASRQFLSEVEKKYANMPFCLRSVEDEKKARMGVVECVKHDLIEPFTVLWEREGELVAQFKFTVLLMPNGPMKITGLPFQQELYKSELSIKDEGIQALLASSASRKTAKKKKKKATQQATGAAEAATVAAEP